MKRKRTKSLDAGFLATMDLPFGDQKSINQPPLVVAQEIRHYVLQLFEKQEPNVASKYMKNSSTEPS